MTRSEKRFPDSDVREYHARATGAADNKSALILAGAPRHVLFTGNADTPYMGGVFNLHETEPLVIELPPAAQRKLKIYPLVPPAKRPAYQFLDRTRDKIDVTLLRWEDNLQVWEKLHKVLQEEPTLDEFRTMYGMLAMLGIEKGKPFRPDHRMQQVLLRAARDGRAALAG